MTWLRFKLFVDIFSALWLAAQSLCFSAPLEKSVAIDVNVDNPRAVQAATAAAMRDWNASGSRMQFTSYRPGDTRFGQPAVLVTSATLPAGQHGLHVYCAEEARHYVVIPSRRRYDSTTLYRIVAHELGHVLGLEHSPFPGDMMSAAGSYRITANDRRRARERWRLR